MVNCPVPRELSDALIPAGLPERLRGVRLLEAKGDPSPETQVMLEVVNGEGVFAEEHLQHGDHRGSQLYLLCHPQE